MNNPDLLKRVETALAEIRPYLQIDGGDISLVGIEDNKIVKVHLLGSCLNCSVNQMTLRSGVEMMIKKYAPEIEKVISVND